MINGLESRFEELRQFNKKFNEVRDKDAREETSNVYRFDKAWH